MKIVVLTGAGISAESGLGTFRDNGGLWEKYQIEEVATPQAWKNNPQLVLDFYNQRRKQCINAQPNEAHYALAELENHFDVQIITQNIDDLHERAGSTKVLHLHGEILKSKSSEKSKEFYPVHSDLKLGDTDPHGNQLRPHVVWFGESVPEITNAEIISRQADIFLIIGTSLNVYPAANLIMFAPKNAPIYMVDPKANEMTFHSDRLVRINQTASIGVPELVKNWTEKKE